MYIPAEAYDASIPHRFNLLRSFLNFSPLLDYCCAENRHSRSDMTVNEIVIKGNVGIASLSQTIYLPFCAGGLTRSIPKCILGDDILKRDELFGFTDRDIISNNISATRGLNTIS